MKAFQGENIYKVQTFSLYSLFEIDGLFLYSAGFFRYKIFNFLLPSFCLCCPQPERPGQH